MYAFDFARYQKNNSTRFSDRRVFTQPGSRSEELNVSTTSLLSLRKRLSKRTCGYDRVGPKVDIATGRRVATASAAIAVAFVSTESSTAHRDTSDTKFTKGDIPTKPMRVSVANATE